MSDKQTLSCDIIDLSYDGRGIGRINGKTCFIDGALPTEKVAFRLNNQKRNYDEGRTTEIISSSEHRVEYIFCMACACQSVNSIVYPCYNN